MGFWSVREAYTEALPNFPVVTVAVVMAAFPTEAVVIVPFVMVAVVTAAVPTEAALRFAIVIVAVPIVAFVMFAVETKAAPTIAVVADNVFAGSIVTLEPRVEIVRLAPAVRVVRRSVLKVSAFILWPGARLIGLVKFTVEPAVPVRAPTESTLRAGAMPITPGAP